MTESMKVAANMGRQKQRNPNLEVFRCLLMFMIVLYHCCLFNAWTPDVPNKPEMYPWMLPFSALLIWHVVGFVALSGWFGIRFSWNKAVRLYGLVLFYSIVSMAVSALILNQRLSWRSIKVDGGWFTATYLGLMLVSPLLNAAFEWLRTDARKLWSTVGLFGLLIFLNWIPTHLYSAISPCGVGGSTLVNFMFIYLLVRAVRFSWENGQLRHTSVPLIGGGALLMVLVFTGTILFSRYRLGISSWTGLITGCQWMFSYDAPYVYLIAIGALLIFVRIQHLPNWLGRFCLFVAPSMFAIYLLHGPSSFGHLSYRWFQSWFSSLSGWHPAVVVVVSSVVVFAVCLGLDLVRRLGLKMVVRVCTRFP